MDRNVFVRGWDMKEKRMNRMLILIFCAVVIVITLLGFWLSCLKFANMIKDNEADLVYTVSITYEQKIEYAMKFGKPINKFFGIQAIMQKNQSKDEDIQKITVFYPGKSALYSTDPNTSSTFVTSKDTSRIDKDTKYIFSRGEGTYDILIPIRDTQEKLMAVYGVSIRKDSIDQSIRTFVRSSLVYVVFLILAGCSIIIICIKFFSSRFRQIKYSAIAVTVLVIAAIQFVVTLPILSEYEILYQKTAKITSSMIGDAVYDEVDEVVVKKGVKYKEIHNLQEWIDKYRIEIDQIESMTLSKPDRADALQIMFEKKLPMDKDEEEKTLFILISESFLEMKKQEVIRDSLTMILISMIILIECMKYIRNAVSLRKKQFANVTENSIYMNFSRLRMFAFISAFICQLPISFIPLAASNMYKGEWQGVSVQLAAGFAISLYIVGAAGAELLVKLGRRYIKWTTVLEAGLCILAVGLCLSGAADNIKWFLGARLLDGVGFGMLYSAFKAARWNEQNKEKQSQILSGISFGLMGGACCGAAIGGMLFDRLGFRQVFFAAGICILIVNFFSKLVIKSVPIPLTESNMKQKSKDKRTLNIKVMLFLALIALPSAWFIMFLNYFFPLYVKSISLAQSDIGRLFLIYGAVVLYAAPPLGKVMCNKLGLKLSTYIAFAATASGIMLFAVYPSIKTAITAVIIMAVMDSFREKAESRYLSQIEDNLNAEDTKTMDRYNSVKSLGYTLGPIAFATGSSFGFASGAGLVGIVSLGMFVLYIIYAVWTSNKNYISYNGRGEWF